MTQLITAQTLSKAFRDHREGERYDVSDSRIAGLQLRVKVSSVRWSLRVRLHGDQKRFDLGPAVLGDEDIDGLCIGGARTRAMRVVEMVRKGQNPQTFLAAMVSGVSVAAEDRRRAPAPVLDLGGGQDGLPV